MSLTVTQAIALTRRYLDATDADDDRWDDDDIKDALSGQIERTLLDVVRVGATAKLVEVVSLAAPGGVADLSSYSLHRLFSVHLERGDNLIHIEQMARPSRWRKQTETAQVTVALVRNYELSSTDSEPLLQVGGTARSLPAFERTVCLRAAKELSIMDAVPMSFATEVLREYETALLGQTAANTHNVFSRWSLSPLYDERRGWSYNPITGALQLWCA